MTVPIEQFVAIISLHGATTRNDDDIRLSLFGSFDQIVLRFASTDDVHIRLGCDRAGNDVRQHGRHTPEQNSDSIHERLVRCEGSSRRSDDTDRSPILSSASERENGPLDRIDGTGEDLNPRDQGRTPGPKTSQLKFEFAPNRH